MGQGCAGATRHAAANSTANDEKSVRKIGEWVSSIGQCNIIGVNPEEVLHGSWNEIV
jgi:hypothetical protein